MGAEMAQNMLRATVGQKIVWLDEVGGSTKLKLVANSRVQIVNVAAAHFASFGTP